MSCISNACRLSIPLHTGKQCEHNVPGWNDYVVVEMHTEASGAFWLAVATKAIAQWPVHLG